MIYIESPRDGRALDGEHRPRGKRQPSKPPAHFKKAIKAMETIITRLFKKETDNMAEQQNAQPEEATEAKAEENQTDGTEANTTDESKPEAEKETASTDSQESDKGKFSADEVKEKVEGEIENALGQLKAIIGVVGVFTEEAFDDAVAFIKKHGRAAK